MNYGFVKTACYSPEIHVADCDFNAEQIVKCIDEAVSQGVELAVFPELCLTGYTCNDLFHQQTLRESALRGLKTIADATEGKSIVAVVGLPLVFNNKLYNVAAVVNCGEVAGFVPKTHMPNYSEFYELRYFTEGSDIYEAVEFHGKYVPFSSRLIFKCKEMPEFILGVEICEDLWSPNPPSTKLATDGATIIANLSASDETVGKAEYRRELVNNQSGRLLCGYAYCSAGFGESTQDMTFAAHNIICENGGVLCESKPFAKTKNAACVTEIDVERLVIERSKNTTFSTEVTEDFNYEIDISLAGDNPLKLTRFVTGQPFVPGDPEKRAERCELIFGIQSRGLASRLAFTHAKTAVIGISGGLDSCLALLVCVRAMEELGRPASDVLAITMPCFGTTKRTRSNAEILCERLGVSFKEINITDTVRSHFKDIGHDESVTDVTFENGQARVRTLELMDIANQTGGLVIGTGDLSELALGWATYNGDHMSMYGVNAGVPKTLVRHMVRYAADTSDDPELSKVLIDIIETPVSPELLPSNGEDISQATEEIVGPYELHDFYLYYVLRFGFTPKKIFALAKTAFEGREEYSDEVLLKWLHNFYRRFFAQQFKRSCLPDGPKVGSVTLSPRGDWRMPTDAYSTMWLKELSEIESTIK
ncbi:MAG: NAD(+) synthase [Clostridia bacterium]|nr:NAD(+) synthase [Clostridia bacterium]